MSTGGSYATPAMPSVFPDDTAIMQHALALAARGLGRVEPNPAVGAVLVDDERRLIADGFHQVFGGPHAEVNALAAAGPAARGATLFVTLEPCCHHGKTPPCSAAVIAAGIKRVVVAMADPFPKVAGGGIAELRAAGIAVDVGLCENNARRLVAPFLTLTTLGRPFVHAKWAMTLDGKIASHSGHSQWISNTASRRVVHELRGRMDAIIIGIGTALADDPALTARPPGPRTPLRVVVDSRSRLPLDSQLVRTAGDVPVLLATTPHGDIARMRELVSTDIEIISLPFANAAPSTPHPQVSLPDLLEELGRRRLTNVLIESGGSLLGSLFDLNLIDELHAFIAPKLVGGAHAASPLAGVGLEQIPNLPQFDAPTITLLGGDIYFNGRIQRPGERGQ